SLGCCPVNSGDDVAVLGLATHGSATIPVTLTLPPAALPILTDTVNISDPDVAVLGVSDFDRVEGSATLSNVVVATFTDPGDPTGSLEDASDYSSTMDWGDGSVPDTGSIANGGIVANGGGSYW